MKNLSFLLAMGGIALLVAGGLLVHALQDTDALLRRTHASQARAFARACADRAVLSLKKDDPIDTTPMTFPAGSCIALPPKQQPDGNVALCIEGKSDGESAHMEITLVAHSTPPRISSWKDVVTFSLCDPL